MKLTLCFILCDNATTGMIIKMSKHPVMMSAEIFEQHIIKDIHLFEVRSK